MPTATRLSGSDAADDIDEVVAADRVLEDLRMADSLRSGRVPRLTFDFAIPLLLALAAEALLLGEALDSRVLDWSSLHRSTAAWVSATALLAALAYALARRSRPPTRQRNRALDHIKEQTKRMAEVSEEMRRAATLPKDSKQREAAVRRIEEKLRALTNKGTAGNTGSRKRE